MSQVLVEASRKFMNFCEIVGYARAAAELARQGYYDEAKYYYFQAVDLGQRSEGDQA